MHPIQRKLLELSQTHDLSNMSLRKIARMVGENHPQKVKHHMQKLGYLTSSPGTKMSADKARLVQIRLLGLANCGEATIYAESYDDKYLQVSQNVLTKKSEDLFAVQAVGDSMNRSDVHGNNIEDGDYAIVDPHDKDFKDGDYVLSLINGMANIKKFTKDVDNHQIILLSESSEDYPPIYIHEDDMSYFLASVKVITVLKKPKKRNLKDINFESF